MTASHTDDVLVTHIGTALWITFNRPSSLNAFSSDMLTEIATAIDYGAGDAGVRAIVLTGAGKSFSAGADLEGDGEPHEKPDPKVIDAANRVTLGLREAPKPIVAAVNGPAAGVGCSFAAAADVVIAAESAYFLLAFANVGLMPDGGATALIPAAIGHARASRMAMLAEPLPASRALDWGLVSAVVADDSFEDEVAETVERLANGPTAAYAQTKRAFNISALGSLSQVLATEREGQSTLLRATDFVEGVAAFREQRPPRFTDT